jgi:hypothetical protein
MGCNKELQRKKKEDSTSIYVDFFYFVGSLNECPLHVHATTHISIIARLQWAV